VLPSLLRRPPNVTAYAVKDSGIFQT